MTFKQALLVSLATIALALSVPILGLWLFTLGENSPHPSDETLIKEFPSKEDGLNQLVKMSNEDKKVIRIACDFTRLDDDWSWPRDESKLGFTKQRWETYCDLFSELSLPVGLERGEPNHGLYIFFPVSTRGLGNGHGSEKGYAHLERDLTPLLDSLNDDSVKNFYAREKPKYQLTLYRRIKGNWYLYRG